MVWKIAASEVQGVSLDDELERIKRKRLDEVIRRQKASEARPQSSSLPAGVRVLTDADFAQETEKHPLMVVDFWAPWCGPCRMVSPIIEELAREYAGRVSFGKVNVDENIMTSSRFEVHSIPTIVFFNRGRPVDAIIGAVPKAAIEAKLRSYIGANASSNA